MLQLIRLNVNNKIGANKKIKEFAFVGSNNCFNNNFKPSAKGCNKPQIPTTSGPFLR